MAAVEPSSGAIRGGAAIALGNAGRQLLRLGVTIVLARMLSPEEFGIVAVMTAVFALGGVFQELGLSAATVQTARLSVQAVSTLFWINAGFGALLALGFAAMAPWIAQFFAHAELTDLCRVAALTFLLNGLGVQRRALLQRSMQFSRQARIDLAAAVLGGVCALGLAMAGWGYWALVGQILVNDGVALLLLLRAVRLAPVKPAWTSEVRDMLRFGGSLFAFNLIYAAAQNLCIVLLGRESGVAAAGIYTRAQALATLPQGLLYRAAAHVALPTMSRVKDSAAEFVTFYYQGIQLLTLVTVPLAVVFAVFGDQIALLVYGPQWHAVSDLLQAFALGLSVAPLLHSTGQIFLARGESHRMLRWGLFGCLIVALGTVLGLHWGAVGVAWGWSIASVLLLWPCVGYAFRGTGISIGGLARAVGGVYAAAACTAPVGMLARRTLEGQPLWLQLPLSLALLLLVYVALCYFVFGQGLLIRAVMSRVFHGSGRRAAD